MSSHQQPAEKFFTLFPRLPPELQLYILTLALPGPQLIYITCLNTRNKQVVIDVYIPNGIVQSRLRSLALAYHSSRYVFLRTYRPWTRTRIPSPVTYSPRARHYDAERDFFLLKLTSFGFGSLPSGSDAAEENREELRVRNLIFDFQQIFPCFRFRSGSHLQNTAREILERVSYFNRLRVLIFYDVHLWKESLRMALHDAARVVDIDLSRLELVFLDFMSKGGIGAALRGWMARR